MKKFLSGLKKAAECTAGGILWVSNGILGTFFDALDRIGEMSRFG